MSVYHRDLEDLALKINQDVLHQIVWVVTGSCGGDLAVLVRTCGSEYREGKEHQARTQDSLPSCTGKDGPILTRQTLNILLCLIASLSFWTSASVMRPKCIDMWAVRTLEGGHVF